MAIVKSGNMYGQVGKLGQNVYYNVSGETRSRSLAASVNNPRTTSQMSQRVRWSNMVNLYRANASWMRYAFETKTKAQSEYNKWMSLNVATSPIYLTKQLAAAGACIVAPYIITQGSLPSIEVTKVSTYWQTNIYLPPNTILNATTTIGALAQAILAYNPAIREGDQISFIRETQQTNSVTGAPYVVVRKYEMLVQSNSTSLVGDYLPLDYIGVRTVAGECFIVVNDSGQAGGFVMILSRTLGGRTYVSTQSIILANMDAILAQYTSNAALAIAIDSYGESEEPFLTTADARQPTLAAAPLSIVSVQVADLVYIPGRTYASLPNWASQDIRVTFSDQVSGSNATIRGYFAASAMGYQVTDPESGTVDDNYVEATQLSSTWDSSEGMALQKIVVTIDGIEYVAMFELPFLE